MASGARQVQRTNIMKSSIIAHVTSVKIRKSHLKRKYALVWHRMCDRSEKPDELKSPVIECAIQVIHVYN